MSEEWQIAIEVGGNDVLLFEGETSLGRGDDSDVVLADSSVSRQHAMLRVDGGQVTIRDLGSSNGTLVGGRKIEGEVELHDGDGIQIGDRVAVVRIRSLLADLEGSASRFGSAEPAVGSATTMLQKASLDLAIKAQAEGREIVDEADPHRRPTEIRPIPDLEAIEFPLLDAASTMRAPAVDLRDDVVTGNDEAGEAMSENPASTLQIPPEDLRAELEALESPAATMAVPPQDLQAEMARMNGPASTMQVPTASATELDGKEDEASPPQAPRIPDADDSQPLATSGWQRLLGRITGWFSRRS